MVGARAKLAEAGWRPAALLRAPAICRGIAGALGFVGVALCRAFWLSCFNAFWLYIFLWDDLFDSPTPTSNGQKTSSLMTQAMV